MATFLCECEIHFNKIPMKSPKYRGSFAATAVEHSCTIQSSKAATTIMSGANQTVKKKWEECVMKRVPHIPETLYLTGTHRDLMFSSAAIFVLKDEVTCFMCVMIYL